MKPANPEPIPQPLPSPGFPSHLPTLIIPGAGTNQVGTELMSQDPMKLFKLANPEHAYVASSPVLFP